MKSPLERARELVGAYGAARARAIAGRDDGEAARARRALGSGEARESIDECAHLGIIDAAEHGSMLAHLALAAHEEVLARRGARPLRIDDAAPYLGAPRSIGELAVLAIGEGDPFRRAEALAAIERADAAERGRRREALAEARQAAAKIAARGPASSDAGTELATLAARVLDDTEDAAREAFARAAHAAKAPPPRTALEALAALRAPGIDALVPARDRQRRLAASLAALGIEGALSSRARMVTPHGEAALASKIAELDPPRRVGIVPSAAPEAGVASEIEACVAIGRAAAALGVAPALPPTLRRAHPGSVGRALGALFADLLADPVFVKRARSLDGAAADALRRAALAVRLATLRTSAARVAAAASGGGDAQAELLARALGAPDASMPAALAAPTPLAPDAEAHADLRAAWLAPAIAGALRERFDSDWFRNPRAAEPIAAAASRGGGLSVEGWAAELGASAEGSARRLAELAR
jgi:hypothetical protein